MRPIDYEELAQTVDQTREVLRAIVAGLIEDGFTEEQARIIVTGVFSAESADKEEDQ